eukprot:m.256030 g.256030  ORF g.256030 m.256030 type:complete len:162 (+) comp15512_c0_seq12:107-592(+)
MKLVQLMFALTACVLLVSAAKKVPKGCSRRFKSYASKAMGVARNDLACGKWHGQGGVLKRRCETKVGGIEQDFCCHQRWNDANLRTCECQNPCHDFTGSDPTQKGVCDQFGFSGSSMPIWYSSQADCNAVDGSNAFPIDCTDDIVTNPDAGAIKYAVCVED